MAKKFLSTLKIVNLPSDPINGSDGELYFNSSASVAKIYQAGAWSVLGAGAGGGSTTVSTTEPAYPEIGDSWYKNDTGEFYVYDGTYWVEVNGVIEPDGVASLLGTANEISVSASIGNIIIGIPDSPVFVTPNIGVATATSINGTTIPNSASLVVSTTLNNYLTQASASSTYQPIVANVSNAEIAYLDGVTSGIQSQIDSKLSTSSASTLYSLTSHNHTLNSLSNVNINSLNNGEAIVWNSASGAWVNQLISGGGGGGGATTTVSETAPVAPTLGDTWYKQSTGSFFIYDGNYWVEVNGVIDSLTGDQVQDYASTLFTHNNHTNITATYDDTNNKIILTSNAQDLSAYLTQASASTAYLTQTSASSTYLTQTAASSTYLAQTTASSTYLAQTTASTTYATKAEVIEISDITPLDNIKSRFNGIQTRFLPTYLGNTIAITNPYRLFLNINGIIQMVEYPELVWGSPLPRQGFWIDDDGYIVFSEAPLPGSTFDARMMAGSTTTTKTKLLYPFEAADILLGE